MNTASISLRPSYRRLRLPTFSTPNLMYLGVGAVLLYLVVPPVLILVQTSFWVATSLSDGYVGTDNYVPLFIDLEVPTLLRNTFVFGLGSAVLGLFLGGTLAWLVERTN